MQGSVEAELPRYSLEATTSGGLGPGQLNELRLFKCRSCQLKKINPQLYNLLPMLNELDLGRNEFKFLDKDEFRDVKHLNKVLLDGNQLSVVVDELFRNQKSLQRLGKTLLLTALF
ncbi:uncharacterized protein LOC118749738 [Rhagoletis pomonella]|uniref:uncharacterized protein LOC118749738 n=1 Tax=Rhagoletis pomonella TaxID=28610 RepID=UPI00178521C4|nr:uncharacterized protein LOC118749738 [Rhagoletis pomonella]